MSVQALNRKEAIASGEDIAPVTREEYYLKGLAEGQGGGGLDYVIPEQTVTLTNAPVAIGSNNLDDVNEGDFIVIRTEGSRTEEIAYIGLSKTESSFNSDKQNANYQINLAKQNNEWYIIIFNSQNTVLADTYTISAIRGF